MAGKNTSVLAIFKDELAVGRAVDMLKMEGFRNTDISVLMADNRSNKDFAHEKDTKAPEGVTTGATTGAVIGGVLGWLAGIGTLAIPGVGPLIAAGPIMATLAGAGVGGATGGVLGALVGMGIPEYEAKRFEGLIKEGRALISVHCDKQEWVSKAKEVLERAGGADIASRNEESATVKGSETDKPIPVRRGPAEFEPRV
jgi:hypothetical protein